MECPNISNLKLQLEDKKALEEIRQVREAGSLLQVSLPSGVLATIFIGSQPAEAAYNIHSTDWILFSQAMESIPKIIRARISQIAKLRLLNGGLSYEQRLFWNAIDRGCGGY